MKEAPGAPAQVIRNIIKRGTGCALYLETKASIVDLLAEQMGVTRNKARQALFHFETVITQGQMLQ